MTLHTVTNSRFETPDQSSTVYCIMDFSFIDMHVVVKQMKNIVDVRGVGFYCVICRQTVEEIK